MRIETLVLGDVRTNCYLLINEETLETIVVDPADRADVIGRKAADEGLMLKAVLLTHGHGDHILAVSDLKRDFGVKVYGAEAEKELLLDPAQNLSKALFGVSVRVEPDVLLKDGQEFEEPGLIVYDIEQSYVGQVREVSPRIGKRISREFPAVRSLYRALQEYLPQSRVVYARGINCAGSDTAGMEEALRVAADADVVILTLGGKNGWGITSTVGEGVDSTDIGLPGMQETFARKVYALHKKTVVLHFDGRPLSNEFVASHFDAVLEVWQPGVMGGQALCKTLFGEYNPGGKLPVTAARNAGQLPVYYGLPRGSGYVSAGHTGMIRNKNGYINDTAFPLYYFGHGLSYTEFAYSEAEVERAQVTARDVLAVSVDVENVGSLPGDEVVQLYFTDQTASMVRPTMELAGFRRIRLQPGEKKRVVFQMKVSQMAFLNRHDNWVVEKGAFTLSIGSSCVDIRQTLQVEVTETARVDERTRGFYAQTTEKEV